MPDGGHWIEVYGDKGTLVIGNPSQTDYVNGFKVYFSEPGAEPKEMPVPKAFDFPKVYLDGRIAPFVRVIDHWVSCIDARQRAIARYARRRLLPAAYGLDSSGSYARPAAQHSDPVAE